MHQPRQSGVLQWNAFPILFSAWATDFAKCCSYILAGTNCKTDNCIMCLTCYSLFCNIFLSHNWKFFVLSYFFPLSYQPERKVEEDQKQKYKRQGRVHMARVEDNRLPVDNSIETSRKKKWRPGKRWLGEWKSPSRPPTFPCRGLYHLWSTNEENMTVAYLHTTCKLNVQETYYKSIFAVILYWLYKLLKLYTCYLCCGKWVCI